MAGHSAHHAESSRRNSARGLAPIWKSNRTSVAPPPVAIGFARNQTIPRGHRFPRSCLPADHAFQLMDPSGGDLLTVIPASGTRRGSLRSFATSARFHRQRSGDTPYADDLRSLWRIAGFDFAPQRTFLTPPQIPVRRRPRRWRVRRGPSFIISRNGAGRRRQLLATERKLHPACGESRAAKIRCRPADLGALLSSQRLCRGEFGPAEFAAGPMDPALAATPSSPHAGGGELYDGPLSRRP
jgi:hypothetical protein